MNKKANLTEALSSRIIEESYDMLNVVEDLYVDIERIWTKIEEGQVTDIKEVSRLLRTALDNTERNLSDVN